MRIASREISPDHPPYVIAEIGVNHDGSESRALELVRLAARAGADAVKFQWFEADLLLSRATRLAAYQKSAGESDPVAMLRRLQLPARSMARARELAGELGLHAIVTIFSVPLVPIALELGWDAYKFASPDIINRPLLDAVAASGRPLILSTGTATLDEVARAANWMREAGAADRTAILQCVSSYPTAFERAALGGIVAIARVASGPVGYSDHTKEVETGAIAVAMGASILEKHFTYDRRASGPDHSASLDANDFARYARLARQAQQMCWPKEKSVASEEHDVRHVSRQSVVSTRDLDAGTRLQSTDLAIKRPGTGLEPWRLAETIGRTLRRGVPSDTPIAAEDLA